MNKLEILNKINKEMLEIRREQIKIKARIDMIVKYHIKLNQKGIMEG